jgi:hypothetical protein
VHEDRSGPRRRRSLLERVEDGLHAFEAWASRRRQLFWTLHSLWALATGLVVVVLAHERYSFVPWVLAMLGLTWVSTLFFCWRREGPAATPLGRLGHGFVSYLTRVMYQETLFFLLPFYISSTPLRPVPGASVVFLVLLVVLAVLSCLDLVFDRYLRSSPMFALVFYATVAFAALSFLLPVVVGIPLRWATVVAAWLAVASGLPLSLQGRTGLGRRLLVGIAVCCGLALGLSAAAPVLVPPVPMRLTQVVFARAVEPDPLAVRGELEGPVSVTDLPEHRVAAMVTIFAPTRLEAEVQLEWELDGEPLASSRPVEILGHAAGFRVWDAVRFREGKVLPGRYRLAVCIEGRLLGRRELVVAPAAASPAVPAPS